MPIERMHRYTRDILRSRPDDLFVFGDNMERAGLGGQAKECRGEANAVGIPTKHRPSNAPDAFFRNADIDDVKPRIREAFRRLAAHVEQGGTVVWPNDGIGTGLAALDRHAPMIALYLEQCEAHLLKLARQPCAATS